MPYPSTTFANFDDLMNYINTYIVTNGMELIEGVEHNAVENGLLTFLRQSPLNWQTAKIESGGGVLTASRPITVFMTTTPTSFDWSDNIYNEYVFINTTLGDIPTITTYYDINLTATTVVPAKSVINICKASNGLWILKSLPSSGSGVVVPPFVGVVGDGTAKDPVAGTSTFQHNDLIGLGSTNSGKIQMTLGEVIMSNYGNNKSFDFDNTTGTIDISPNTFVLDDSLYINRNQ